MGFFDGWDWNGIANGIARSAPAAISNFVGASQVASANQRAAQMAADNAAANRAVLTSANTTAQGYLQPQIAAGAPAADYLRTVMAQNPNELTPQQEIQLADTRRQAVTATPSGLRGSGRYLTASINDVNNRGRAGMVAANTGRADAAANTLASRGAGAATGAANLASNLGTQVANVNTTGADAGANAITTTADSNNAALQNIGSFFANAVKDADRESRYRGFKTGFA
ncbi:MAG: hypothetical protein Q8P46_10515 [Hyphomicrobiales bacterium]|nr:hypothetical protein [Hyphomicrobiales bacterium]